MTSVPSINKAGCQVRTNHYHRVSRISQANAILLITRPLVLRSHHRINQYRCHDRKAPWPRWKPLKRLLTTSKDLLGFRNRNAEAEQQRNGVTEAVSGRTAVVSVSTSSRMRFCQDVFAVRTGLLAASFPHRPQCKSNGREGRSDASPATPFGEIEASNGATCPRSHATLPPADDCDRVMNEIQPVTCQSAFRRQRAGP